MHDYNYFIIAFVAAALHLRLEQLQHWRDIASGNSLATPRALRIQTWRDPFAEAPKGRASVCAEAKMLDIR